MESRNHQPPLAYLKAIGFELMTSKEIRQLSVMDKNACVQKQKILVDSRLGLPNYEGKCSTCNAPTTAHEYTCPGHFGHLSLVTPVFNPEHINILLRILNEVCPWCGALRGKNKTQNEISMETGSDRTFGGGCKYCKEGSEDRYPKLNFKIGTKRYKNQDIDVIEVKLSLQSLILPDDLWGFLERTVVLSENRISRPLLPAEAMKILRKMSKDTVEKIGLILLPDALIIKDILIPPNCQRFVESSKPGYSSRNIEYSQKTKRLSEIISKNNSIKKPFSDLYAVQQESAILQAKVSNYFNAFKIFVNSENQELSNKLSCGFRKRKKSARRSGPTWFKENILGKRTHYSALAVISGDPYIQLEQMAIPYNLAQKLRVPEIVNRFNWEKLSQYIFDSQNSICKSDQDGTRMCIVGDEGSNLKFGEIIERPLQDGDLVFANRAPSIHMHSFIGFTVKLQERSTFGINPMICSPYSADFDGDTLHVYTPTSFNAKAEVSELMIVHQQMICSQAGQSLLGLSQDGLLAGYLLLQRHFWLQKCQMQMLNIWCDSVSPKPAIVKAPRSQGPLWTGLQILSMTLPEGINFRYSTALVVVDSEILLCPFDKNWMKSKDDGLITRICCEAGPEIAVRFLTCLQTVLTEWFSLCGFSVGLRDFLLTEDFKSHEKLLAEITTAMEDARASSRRAIHLSDHEEQVDISCGKKGHTTPMADKYLIRRDTSDQNNKAHPAWNWEALDNVGISEFQSVYNDIETTVERHISFCNPLYDMVRCGSKGSLKKLVQQSACLGLQLLNGKRWFSSKKVEECFSEFPGILQSSFLHGLTSNEFFSHLIPSRTMPKTLGVDGPGQMFRDCMFCLRELYSAYDGSIRTRNGNHVVQFCYGGLFQVEHDGNDKTDKFDYEKVDLENEAVGVHAVSAIIQPAYNVTFDQAVSTMINPVDLLKVTLSKGLHQKKATSNDFKAFLRLSYDDIRRRSDRERAAFEVKGHLQPITLELLTSTVFIEHSVSGNHQKKAFFILHFHLSLVALNRFGIKLKDVAAILWKHQEKNRGRKTEVTISSNEQCDYGISGHQDESMPCTKVHITCPEDLQLKDKHTHVHELFETLKSIEFIGIPSFLKMLIKGSSKIKFVRIRWEEPDHTCMNIGENEQQKVESYGFHHQFSGELILEVHTNPVLQRGMAWETIKDACCGIHDLIDWRRSGPSSIAEICSGQGVEAARHCIYKRLEVSVKGMGTKVHHKHLSLISDYMTHTGRVLAFTANGMKLWNKDMKISLPFTEGANADPKGVFMDAARKKKTERLTGILASIVWGNFDGMDPFDIFMSPRRENQIPQSSDILDLLQEAQRTLCLIRMSPHKSEIEDVLEDTEMSFPPGFEPGNDMTPRDWPIMGESLLKYKEDSLSFENMNGSSRMTLFELTSSVQRILHKFYKDDELVSKPDMEFLEQKILVHHPNCHQKIGSGIIGIKVGHNPDYPESRCFILLRKDGSSDNFSYHKCLQNIPGI